MRQFATRGIVSGSLLSLGLLLCVPEGDASITVGRAALPHEQLAQIFARGDCPDILATQPCGPEDFCASNQCSGNPYNPYQSCVDDCIEDCQDLCEIVHAGNQAAILACQESCESSTCSECDELPDMDAKDCGSAVSSNKTREFSSYPPAIHDAGESGWEDVYSEEWNCFSVCACTSYCFWVQISENPVLFDWRCATSSEDCTHSGTVDFAIDGMVGDCPPDESD